MMHEHTSKQFDADLEAVRSRVLKMGGLVEEQIVKSVEALTTGNIELAKQVQQQDHLVNGMEVAIDEDCNHIIARRQPTAGDLRMVMTVVKTITDLERIGDEAAKIARMTLTLYGANRLTSPRFSEIRLMSSQALDMLRTSLDAFARLEVASAVQVAKQDLQVDDEFKGLLRHLITFMMEDPRTISDSIDILFAAKAIERMGDHAKNMAEYVVYMVKGKDVRHTNILELEQELQD
ncbi:MAG TPA: phosphate signaling complex protein PhoU [Burkholderiales bacterium]|nr:phosphate signaling complex protein PhoU [Pseudomonadota bacterium]HVC50334.1 phosphate signaling complex protein PhoU [Burkholderiales bacterium]